MKEVETWKITRILCKFTFSQTTGVGAWFSLKNLPYIYWNYRYSIKSCDFSHEDALYKLRLFKTIFITRKIKKMKISTIMAFFVGAFAQQDPCFAACGVIKQEVLFCGGVILSP